MSKQRATRQTQAATGVEKAFRAFLQATSLSEDLYRDHVHLGRSYGSNNALLGWDDSPFRAAIKLLRNVSPQVSERTIGGALRDSMIRLFEEHIMQQEVDGVSELVLDSIAPRA